MKKRKQKPERTSRVPAFLRRRAGALALGAFAILFVHDLFGDHGFFAMRRSQKEVEQLREEIRQIDEENRRLAGQVKALKSDPKMIERIAREEMGLARPGELVFKLPPKPETSPEKNQEE